ncbi:MAG TPA: HD domain-containing protein [Xanthomonadales bacterium]|nr:HD domain-containing protein [Xanthomonadales bacterium]
MQAVVDFILEIDKLKSVTRKVMPMSQDRYENSAEHSWQLALLALSLAPHAEPGTDIDRVVKMLLVHDIGEIDTGDTLAFVEHGWADRKAAELAAVTRIFGMLPAGQGAPLLALWEEFEAAQTRESRFANAIDRVMPVLLNLANRGQSWRENDVSYDRVIRRIEPPIRGGCPALWEWLAPRLERAREDGFFGG